MKYLCIMLMLCFSLLSFSCENGENEHDYITIHNQSNSDVFLCLLFTDVHNKCNLSSGGTIEKNSILKWNVYKESIEQNLKGAKSLEFYLVDPNHYNDKVFYDCDSIGIKNNILKYYKLTLSDLKKMNWEVIYNGN